MPTWMITGCSTGLGRALARTVLERGWNAVVTARNLATIQDFAELYEGRVLLLPLDVTDPSDIANAIRDAHERFGGIDVLVNNAGYGYRAAIEEADEEDVERLFATNVFGTVAMIKAALPDMRAKKRGTIVNISSTAGRMAQPGSGYYSATKYAVEGLSQALRKEVSPLGLSVIVVQPGGFRTDFAGRSMQQSTAAIEDYAATAGVRRKENDRSDGRQPGDPARAAAAIVKAVESKSPPRQLALGKGAVTRIRAELEAQLKELETWAALGESADFPKET